MPYIGQGGSTAGFSHQHDFVYYTEDELNVFLSGKSNTSHLHDDRYYTETEVNVIADTKSDTSHLHDDRYFTETEANANFSASGHDHDSRYYTESEVSTLLSGKSDTAHQHTSYDAAINTSGASVLDELTVVNGIVTKADTRTLTKADIGLSNVPNYSSSTSYTSSSDSTLATSGALLDGLNNHDSKHDDRFARLAGNSWNSFDGYDVGARRYIMSGYTTTGGHATGGRIYAYAGGNTDWIRMYGHNVVDGTNCLQIQVVNSARVALEAGGNGRFDGGADIGNADYAEMFEWDDGNPSEEDRIGRTVVMVNEKVRLAVPVDDTSLIIGSVSGAPGVIGDSAYLNWKGLDLRDDFNRKIWTTIDLYSFTYGGALVEKFTMDNIIEKFGEDFIIPDDAVINSVPSIEQNPDYDQDLEYVPREDRQEWDAIGLMGKLRILKGQPVGDRWIKMRDITDEIEEWLIR